MILSRNLLITRIGSEARFLRITNFILMTNVKREIDHRLATHFHPAALSAQIAEVGQTEGKSQAKLLLM